MKLYKFSSPVTSFYFNNIISIEHCVNVPNVKGQGAFYLDITFQNNNKDYNIQLHYNSKEDAENNKISIETLNDKNISS